MLNLNDILGKTTEIKIEDKVIRAKDITVKQFERMLDIEEKGSVKEQAKLIAEILSNNTEGVKYTVEQVENFTRPAVIALWQLFATKSLDTSTDPN